MREGDVVERVREIWEKENKSICRRE